jgi:hypothetical protein
VTYGAAILEHDGYTYVYGVEDLSTRNYLHIARVPAGGLLGPWEFFTGSGWASDPASSARLLDGVDNGFGVLRIGSAYVLMTLDASDPFSGKIVAYWACSPAGPWGNRTLVYTTPENNSTTFTYSVNLHPEFTSRAGLLLSYDVNSWTWSGAHQNVQNYRPRFLRLKSR